MNPVTPQDEDLLLRVDGSSFCRAYRVPPDLRGSGLRMRTNHGHENPSWCLGR